MRSTIFILLAAFALILGGCDKFLEEIPTGAMTNKTVFSTSDDANALTVAPYRALPLWVGGAGDWGNYLPGTLEYPTGKAASEDAHVLLWRYQSNQVSGDLLNNFNNQWQNWYQGVRDCNFSIEKLGGITTVSASEISKSLGAVRTLRAWYYFNLVRYFGDVPMITSVIENVGDAQNPRTSLKKIYDEVIIPDLEFAVNESSLADIRSTNGFLTKYAARAILADVYLTCAGYPYQEVATNETGNWSVEGAWMQQGYPVNTPSARAFLLKAQAQLNALYGKYELGTYQDLHDPAMNNKGEAIFQAQFLEGVVNNGIIAAALPIFSHISMFGDENGTFIPTVSYFNSYSSADKRIKDRQMFFYSDNLSKKFDRSEPPADKFSRPYLYKFYDAVAIKQTGRSGLNWTFYRYADMLLMLTEVNWALKELGESVSEQDIIKGINEVRARAELPAFRSADITLREIMSERAYELIFENKMLWDQRRTRMCLVDGNGQFAAIEPFIGHRPKDFSFAFSAMNLLSPIPGREIANNKKVLQNFGYLPRQIGQQ